MLIKIKGKKKMITKEMLEEVRVEVYEAMNEIAKKHGLSFKQEATISYSDSNFYFNKLSFVEGSLENNIKKEFDKHCKLFGLESYHFGKKFNNGKLTYEIIGFELNRSRYPIKTRCIETNKTVLFDTSILVKL